MTGNRPPPAGCPRSADFDDYVREHYPALRRLVADPHPYVRRAVVNAASTWRLRRLLHDAVDAAQGPHVDPVPALRRRRTRTRARRRLQVTAVTLRGLVVVGQALLPPPAAGEVRTDVAVLAAP